MNRRQRRAQAVSNVDSAEDIPLVHPNRGPRTTKTLLEIAAERQAQLLPQTGSSVLTPRPEDVVNLQIGTDGKLQSSNGASVSEQEAETATVDPLLDTLFLAVTLSALHFTLEVLTVHQYAQELVFGPIFFHTICIAFPILALVIHFSHGHLVALPSAVLSAPVRRWLYVVQQLVFLGMANLTGCYLVHLTNDKGYYAVMKKAPSIGTVWVWSVLEMGLAGALAGVAGPGAYAWYHGYGIF